MIIGLGIDLAQVARISAVRQRHGDRFLDRTLTAGERAYCLEHRDPDERIAARWAAKEAAGKALGTGIADGVHLTDIAVVADANGAPHLELTGGALARATALGADRWHVSLSHAGGFATAVVILEKTSHAHE